MRLYMNLYKEWLKHAHVLVKISQKDIGLRF